MKILLLNGPNLGRLGTRAPEIYGTTTLPEIVEACSERAAAAGWDMDALQSNHEGVVLDRIEQRDYDAVIINPGAWSHYSYALADGLAACDVPVVEVHISDVYAREEFRHFSVVEALAAHRVIGKGWRGYVEAVDWVAANAGPRQTR